MQKNGRIVLQRHRALDGLRIIAPSMARRFPSGGSGQKDHRMSPAILGLLNSGSSATGAATPDAAIEALVHRRLSAADFARLSGVSRALRREADAPEFWQRRLLRLRGWVPPATALDAATQRRHYSQHSGEYLLSRPSLTPHGYVGAKPAIDTLSDCGTRYARQIA
ncbi:MAG: F-box protein, partial [Oxalobacteraceae bacterium]